MGFRFTEEQRMMAENAYKWANSWLEPQMEELEKEQKCPPDLFIELGKLGLNGIVFEEKYGGAGLGYVETCLIYEAIGRISSGISGGVIGPSQTLCFDNFRRNAKEEHKMEVLPKACTGEYIGALGITEPNAGSDAMSMRTTAVKKGDSYIINGSKIFITNSPIADVMMFYAKTDPQKGPHGISAFWFYLKNARGVTIDKIDKWGFRTSPSGLVTFEDVVIPEENLVGKLNGGVSVLTSGLCTERITLAGSILGMQRACIELSIKYSKERVQFGKPIGSFQLIQGKLADMYCGYEASKWMVYRAADYCDSSEDKHGGKGTDLDLMAAAAILFSSERGTQIASDAVQIHGGYGICTEYPVSRHYTDSKLWEIGAGTSEIRRLIVAREMLRDGFAMER
ncbi:MAG TPA: acyl-CoA dehydrogenase [Syntrophaceae bacterium]|nr:acyl-CoA dehydrogenase [Syntrophaceae bacterium]